jgi:hypothetical protein
MKLQPITYRGHTVAAATPKRFFLADELSARPPGDPHTTFVCFMCAYAREVLTGGLPGPYTDEQAREFARAALIPDELLDRDQLDIQHTARAIHVPADEFQHARAQRAAAWP